MWRKKQIENNEQQQQHPAAADETPQRVSPLRKPNLLPKFKFRKSMTYKNKFHYSLIDTQWLMMKLMEELSSTVRYLNQVLELRTTVCIISRFSENSFDWSESQTSFSRRNL